MIVERNGDQVCLRQHSHVNETLKKLANFRKEGILCDVTIIVEGKTFSAHKNILASGSQYFKVMFTGEMAESRQKEITLESITSDVFEQIIQYFYEGTLTMDMISVADTLHAASLLLLKDIENECFYYLKRNMNLKNCVRIKSISEMYSNKELIRKSNDYVKRNFEKLTEEKEITNLSLKDLKILLSSDDLMCKSEDAIAKVIQKWLSVRPNTSTDDTIHFLLKAVRIPYLTEDGLAFLQNAVKDLDVKNSNCDFTKVLINEQKLQNRLHKKNALKCRAALVKENVLFCVGRYGDCYCYSMSSNKFRKLESYPEMKQPNDIIVHGHSVYAVGSSNLYSALCSFVLYSYDTKDNKWTRLPSMSHARCLHCAVFLDGKLYVIGGKNYESSDTTLNQSVECYDPVTKSWSIKTGTTEPRINACTVSTNKYIYVIGGETSNTEQQGSSSVERYCPHKDTWEKAPSLTSRRMKSTAVYFNDKIYVFGGRNIVELHTFEYLEVANNGKQWIQVAFPYATPIHAALTVDDKILALGHSFWGDDLVLQYYAQRRRGHWQKVNNFIHTSHRNKSFKYVSVELLNYDVENKQNASCDCNDGESSAEEEYISSSDIVDSDDDVLMEFAPWGLWV